MGQLNLLPVHCIDSSALINLKNYPRKLFPTIWEKMAWMLREVFDYREALPEKKQAIIHNMHDFVRDQPKLLFYSVANLEKRKDRLREKAVEYLK